MIMQHPDVDPDLARQLDAARSDEPVEAVLLLRLADGRARPLIDVEALMQWVRQQNDHAEMNYMPRIGALVVRAPSQVIRLLISQPEVEIASANRIVGDATL
jgi:hypothetical protein